MTITDLHIKRMQLPTLRVSDAHNGVLAEFDTYAEVSCDAFNDEVVRFSYWTVLLDSREDIEQTYDFRIGRTTRR
jgi:hypothetical protein